MRNHLWKRRFEPSTQGNKTKFHGLICCWYFDGKKMWDPLFIVDTPISVWHTKKGGGITGMVEKDYSFYGKPEQYTVSLRNESIDLNCRLTPVNKALSSPVHRVTHKPFGMKYEIYKHLLYDFQGEMMEENSFKKVKGTAYFQKVLVNAPAFPWFWGMFSTENGYYLDYMLPHLGPSAFRRKKSHRSGLDRSPIYINPSIEFFDAGKKEWTIFTKTKIQKEYRKNLPVFKVKGNSSQAHIELEATTYSRAHWRFQQGSSKKRVFYYNEYPATLTGFQYRKGARKLNLDDLGHATGNCEHSWGSLF